jgi:hypothetical protein
MNQQHYDKPMEGLYFIPKQCFWDRGWIWDDDDPPLHR